MFEEGLHSFLPMWRVNKRMFFKINVSTPGLPHHFLPVNNTKQFSLPGVAPNITDWLLPPITYLPRLMCLLSHTQTGLQTETHKSAAFMAQREALVMAKGSIRNTAEFSLALFPQRNSSWCLNKTSRFSKPAWTHRLFIRIQMAQLGFIKFS